MNDLRELYQQVILDHNKNPRNYREMPNATSKIEGYNPLCGDKVTVYVKLEDDLVKDVAFQGTGCAISTASASLMTESLKGKTRAEAEAIFREFHDLITGKSDEADAEERLGKLAVFGGVREFPVRIKCASLPWHTFHAAVEGEDKTVSTE